MAAVNPEPLQARPYERHVAAEGDEGEYDDEEDAMDDVEEENGSNNEVILRKHGGGFVTRTTTCRTSELTLSFEGEVYVFPAVTPEKVIN